MGRLHRIGTAPDSTPNEALDSWPSGPASSPSALLDMIDRPMIDAETGWYFVPATLKAVVASPERRVLLATNRRRQWELPGGWPTADDRCAHDVLRREVLEESGVHVRPARLLHAELAVVDGTQVMIVAYLCMADEAAPSTSPEHTDVVWSPHDSLPPLEFPVYDVAIARGLAATQ